MAVTLEAYVAYTVSIHTGLKIHYTYKMVLEAEVVPNSHLEVLGMGMGASAYPMFQFGSDRSGSPASICEGMIEMCNHSLKELIFLLHQPCAPLPARSIGETVCARQRAQPPWVTHC